MCEGGHIGQSSAQRRTFPRANDSSQAARTNEEEARDTQTWDELGAPLPGAEFRAASEAS